MAHDLNRPSDPKLAPGEARCPGPSTRDIILGDVDDAPQALLTEEYEFLGDADVGYERYTSQAFFDAEMTHLWPRTWQWACREEHIPEVGDWMVYDIGPQSFIVVRTAPDRVQAFYNSCLHRGMQLCEPGTSGRGARTFRCPFHGFSYKIDGGLHAVPCRWDFPHIDDESFRLPEAQVGLWGGFVFINPDLDAGPLTDFLEVLPEHFRSWPLEDRYVALHVEKVLPANWKMAMEAFLEAYHVFATHSQTLFLAGDANAQYDVFGEHVTRFIHTIGFPSPHLAKPMNDEQLAKVMGAWDPETGPERLAGGATARTFAAERSRKLLGERYGVDLSDVSNSEMLDSIEYHLFPNMFLFPGVSLPMIYRFRPNGMDVDSSLMEILFMEPVPPEGRPDPAPVYRLGEDDSYTTVPGFDSGLGPVYDQDTVNLRRQRDGVKASKKAGQTLGNYQEVRIRRFHMTLDRVLGER
jgi:phenylpropionate dioxygenase-like ring-hydroxylating dioxygenase large terminal subunit